MCKSHLEKLLNDGITRRDFLNGILIASGAAVADSLPRLASADDAGVSIDLDALRGGNLPSVFNVGHWLRDGRLTFYPDKIKLAPASYDTYQGDFDILQDGGSYDVIIEGAGISGLAAAFFIQRRRPGTRLLMLDANPVFGGNAGRDDMPPIPTIASTAGAYAVTPYDDFLYEIYGTIGIDWSACYVPDPVYCYFFDEHTPYANAGTRSWTRDVYGKGVDDMPYPQKIIRDLKKARQDFRNWYNRNGSPNDPADYSAPSFDYLAVMTLDEYFNERGYEPAVSDFYTRYAVDSLGGKSTQVSAYTAISFLGAEYFPLFTFPGGTSGIARHLLKWLIPQAINGKKTDDIINNPIRSEELDRFDSAVRVRQDTMVLRADTDEKSANVIYFRNGKFLRASAKAVILAGQGYTAHRIAGHIMSSQAREAWEDFSFIPVVIANVTLKSAAPLIDLGLGYNQYYWGSTYWASFVVADWVKPSGLNRNRPTVLTFYCANEMPPEEMHKERVKLLTTPFLDYENSLRDDLNRILAQAGFDFDRDVSAVYIYRWGHAMIYPKPGFAFGAPTYIGGRAVRTPAARHIARAQIGRISIAGQDVESSPAIEGAIGSGLRTALEVLPLF